MFNKLIFTLSLSLSLISSSALAQPDPIEGGDISFVGQRAFLEDFVREHLKYVLNSIDKMNPDQFASSFRCPLKEDQTLGDVHSVSYVKSVVSGIKVKVGEQKVSPSISGEKVGMLIQPIYSWADDNSFFLLSIQRETLLKMIADGVAAEELELRILQAVCSDKGGSAFNMSAAKYLVKILQSVQ